MLTLCSGDSMGKERREYSRVAVSWRVLVLTSHGLIEGEVKNVSFGGACIEYREPIEPGENIELSFLLSERDSLSVSAMVEVVWPFYNSSTSTPSYQLGVRFADVSEEDMQMLSRAALL
jgi:hypothetical protein